MKTNTKAKFILITVVFVLITTIVLGVCPLPIYWKIPVMFLVRIWNCLVLASEYMAVMMGYMCKEGDDD